MKQPLFRFVVFTDCHLESAATPEPRSNRRASRAIEAINGLKPDFAIYLGDFTQAPPNMAAQKDALDAAKSVFSKLEAPWYSTPGNVDIGDKPSPWMPANSVARPWLASFAQHIGPLHQVFSHKGCTFFLLNSPILNSGFEEEALQRQWFESALGEYSGQRIFLMTHYPPFLMEPHEHGHYDNINQPGRDWLLDLLRQHRVEAVFSGHIHNVAYNRLDDCELYVLPSTAFVRRDYSEMYGVSIPDRFEHGRNDTEKLGFFLVEVHSGGHIARFVKTGGATDAPIDVVLPLHPKDDSSAIAGVYLRFPWASAIALPLQSPVDEFRRRRVRNDYIVQAIWDLGVRDLRVPVDDLLDDEAQQRMRDLARLGHRFIVSQAGCPTMTEIEALTPFADTVDRWERILPKDRVEASIPQVLKLASMTARPVSLAIRQNSAERKANETLGKYTLGHGFALDQEMLAARMLEYPGARDAYARLIFGVGLDDDLTSDLPRLDALSARLAVPVDVTVFMAADHPDTARKDQADTAAKVALAAIIAHGRPNLSLFFDTFMDMDRSYYPRVGMVDRFCNFNPAGYALSVLHAVLPGQSMDALQCRGEPYGRIHIRRGARRSVLLAEASAPADLFVAATDGLAGAVALHDVMARSCRNLNLADCLETYAACRGPRLAIIDHD